MSYLSLQKKKKIKNTKSLKTYKKYIHFKVFTKKITFEIEIVVSTRPLYNRGQNF